ncbi:hypothetical protein F2P81_011708 [Scophthalmus maximus]|uniref:Uncharacterized protein n=1 Tax=Scophthalmus maximus TaxID=52904 RepID=A0A6A4SMF7_SCOMX|nr:hypothetical protein F2P81_011708 [Scophthalmus maximus]
MLSNKGSSAAEQRFRSYQLACNYLSDCVCNETETKVYEPACFIVAPQPLAEQQPCVLYKGAKEVDKLSEHQVDSG